LQKARQENQKKLADMERLEKENEALRKQLEQRLYNEQQE
jgi:hypothetical protein